MPFDYDQLKTGYYDEVYRRRRGVQSKWHHLKFARVRRAMPAFDRHLDIGCGPGTFISTLDGPGTSIGVDISAAQVQYARRHYGSALHEFLTLHGEGLPFADDTFDVVTMLELIEHLPQSQGVALLREVRRVLRSGGCLILTTPNYASLWPLLECLVNRLSPVSYADQHITHYDGPFLRRLLVRCGYRVAVLDTHPLAAPFCAALGWRLADIVDKIESALLIRRLGHLLIAKGIKPCRPN